jgi:uncharacterized OsmC-like protein
MDRAAFVLGMRRAAMADRQHTKRSRNGLDLRVLHEAVDAIREEPEAGAITVRTRHRWDSGFAVDGYAQEFEDADGVTPRTFRFRTDWPPEVGGDDSGASPGEVVLAALGGCVAMTYITKAAMRGIDIEDLEVSIEGRVDLRGFFELDPVRAGLSNVSITVRVRSTAADSDLDDLGRAVARSSAVFDTLANPVSMQLAVQRLP